MNAFRLNCAALLVAAMVSPSNAQSGSEKARAAAHVSDQSIESAIQNELRSIARLKPPAFKTPGLEAPQIQVSVIANEVTLRGNISSFLDRRRVESEIASIEGVHRINNWLRVKRSPIQPRQGARVDSRQRAGATLISLSHDAPSISIRGKIEIKADDILIVEDFREGRIETRVDESAAVTLDGKPIDDEVLGEGLIVLVDAVRERGEWVAKSIEAHSPK